jgi:hypothetical protein
MKKNQKLAFPQVMPEQKKFCSGITCGKASFWFFCRVGAPLPRLKTETDPVSETLFSVCRNPDDGQSPEA